MTDETQETPQREYSAEELETFREGVLKRGEEWQLLMPELLGWGLR